MQKQSLLIALNRRWTISARGRDTPVCLPQSERWRKRCHRVASLPVRRCGRGDLGL